MRHVIRFSASAYDRLKLIARLPAEAGAIIGSSASSADYITHAWFDAPAGYGKQVYVPSVDQITRVVRRWAEQDAVCFCGIIHSHADIFPASLSAVDIRSALSTMKNNAMSFLYMGLFHRGNFFVFKVFPDATIEEMQVIIETDDLNNEKI